MTRMDSPHRTPTQQTRPPDEGYLQGRCWGQLQSQGWGEEALVGAPARPPPGHTSSVLSRRLVAPGPGRPGLSPAVTGHPGLGLWPVLTLNQGLADISPGTLDRHGVVVNPALVLKAPFAGHPRRLPLPAPAPQLGLRGSSLRLSPPLLAAPPPCFLGPHAPPHPSPGLLSPHSFGEAASGERHHACTCLSFSVPFVPTSHSWTLVLCVE